MRDNNLDTQIAKEVFGWVEYEFGGYTEQGLCVKIDTLLDGSTYVRETTSADMIRTELPKKLVLGPPNIKSAKDIPSWDLPKYSSDIAAAFKILEKYGTFEIRTEQYEDAAELVGTEAGAGTQKPFEVQIGYEKNGGLFMGYGEGDSVPEAICMAALDVEALRRL